MKFSKSPELGVCRSLDRAAEGKNRAPGVERSFGQWPCALFEALGSVVVRYKGYLAGSSDAKGCLICIFIYIYMNAIYIYTYLYCIHRQNIVRSLYII